MKRMVALAAALVISGSAFAQYHAVAITPGCAYGINDFDQVVGASTQAGFLYSGTSVSSLSSYGIQAGIDINNTGDILGEAVYNEYPGGWDSHYLLKGTTRTTVGSTYMDTSTTACKIGNNGTVIGNYSTHAMGFTTQYGYAGATKLPNYQPYNDEFPWENTIVPTISRAFDISDTGMVVGSSTMFPNQPSKNGQYRA